MEEEEDDVVVASSITMLLQRKEIRMEYEIDSTIGRGEKRAGRSAGEPATQDSPLFIAYRASQLHFFTYVLMSTVKILEKSATIGCSTRRAKITYVHIYCVIQYLTYLQLFFLACGQSVDSQTDGSLFFHLGHSSVILSI